MTTCYRLSVAGFQTDACDVCQPPTPALKRMIGSFSHVQLLIDFVTKTIDSLSHLLRRGTRSPGCEESADIWQI